MFKNLSGNNLQFVWSYKSKNTSNPLLLTFVLLVLLCTEMSHVLHYYMFPITLLSLSLKKQPVPPVPKHPHDCCLVVPSLCLYISMSLWEQRLNTSSAVNIPDWLAQSRVRLKRPLDFCSIISSVNRLIRKFRICLQPVISTFLAYLSKYWGHLAKYQVHDWLKFVLLFPHDPLIPHYDQLRSQCVFCSSLKILKMKYFKTSPPN